MSRRRTVLLNADRIRWEMDVRAWTIADLAGHMGISESGVSQLLRRKNCLPTTKLRLAEAFKQQDPIPGLAELLIDEGQEPPAENGHGPDPA